MKQTGRGLRPQGGICACPKGSKLSFFSALIFPPTTQSCRGVRAGTRRQSQRTKPCGRPRCAGQPRKETSTMLGDNGRVTWLDRYLSSIRVHAHACVSNVMLPSSRTRGPLFLPRPAFIAKVKQSRWYWVRPGHVEQGATPTLALGIGSDEIYRPSCARRQHRLRYQDTAPDGVVQQDVTRK